MRNYELTFLLSPEIEEKNLKEFQQKIKNLIEKIGGVLISSLSPIKRTLFYSIKKKTEAFLGVCEFQMEPKALEDLKKNLEKESEILRFLILVKKPSKKVEVLKRPKEKVKRKAKLEEIDQKLKEILGEKNL
jgi:small subunit ribosomal protein S6